MGKKRQLVNASDIGQAAYCPHALSLSKRLQQRSHNQKEATDKGSIKHAQLNDRLDGKGDGRCFVASYAFGSDHAVTGVLRQWRDQRLLPRPYGPALVSIYYVISPIAIRLFGWIPGFKWISRQVITLLLKFIGERSS